LLSTIGITPVKILSPDINEIPLIREKPTDYSKRIAKQKIKSLLEECEGQILLTADTVVYCGRRIIDKTTKIDEAKQNLHILSGKRHKIMTSVCVKGIDNKIRLRSVTTTVHFKRISDRDIDNYLKLNEWQDAAGSYKIQGFAEGFIKSINGSYSNVVGLPLYETRNLLQSSGLEI
tara:strand:+ start:262 stop:789 length:528 start_codon:yes stop_codon:yes gene_type:complete